MSGFVRVRIPHAKPLNHETTPFHFFRGCTRRRLVRSLPVLAPGSGGADRASERGGAVAADRSGGKLERVPNPSWIAVFALVTAAGCVDSAEPPRLRVAPGSESQPIGAGDPEIKERGPAREHRTPEG